MSLKCSVRRSWTQKVGDRVGGRAGRTGREGTSVDRVRETAIDQPLPLWASSDTRIAHQMRHQSRSRVGAPVNEFEISRHVRNPTSVSSLPSTNSASSCLHALMVGLMAGTLSLYDVLGVEQTAPPEARMSYCPLCRN